MTPVAVFDPVELCGATVRQATLHNVANIFRLTKETASPEIKHWLAVEDTIVVSRRNDVIPCVEDLVKASGTGRLLSPPARCPSCDTALHMLGEYLVCPNSAECEAQTAGSIKRWIKKVGVKDFGGSLVEALCAAGTVSEPADLYRSPKGFWQRRSSRDAGSGILLRRLRSRICARRCPCRSMYSWVPSGSSWSRSMVKVLVATGYDTLSKMGAAQVSDLVKIAGVEETKAKAFVEGFIAVRPKIQNLLQAGVTIMAEATGSSRVRRCVSQASAMQSSRLRSRARVAR